MEKFYQFCGLHDLDLSVVEKNIQRLKKLLKVENFEDILHPLNSLEEVLENILDKYTLNTAISMMETIKYIGIYFAFDKNFMYKHSDEFNSLLDLRDNKNMYSNFSIFEVKRILEEKVDYILQNHHCYTYLRNFIVVYIFLNEIPFRLSHFTQILLIRSDYENLDDFDEKPFYLVLQKGEFFFVVNKINSEGVFLGQYIHKVENTKSHKLLTRLIVNFGTNSKYFIANKSGKDITNTNLANAITTFTKGLFGKSISLNQLRTQTKVYSQPLNINLFKKKILDL
tara:strand:- start:304 stop:1152 length:849 start_codon:yes stop_codon:yes gene_type:complete